MAIPEYIEGIPTKKNAVKERETLILSYYEKLWKRLQREVNSNYIINNYLQTKIYIVKNTSDKKTKIEAKNNWKSTYAVKHLYTVVKHARPLVSGVLEYSNPKSGNQKNKGFKQMLILYYTFSNDNLDYLNFTVKLTIGIKADKKHVQYCVNKIEV
ncbi:MAG: hypothetical protein IKQ94_05730 [Bacteroidales bacterium]|nr:hypothetical protein [Bacteroidales bacterium]